MPKIIVILFSLAVFNLQAAPVVVDLENGAKLAKKKCARCHGELGVSDDIDTPHLAGQNARYLIKQLADYKSKARVDKNMYKRARKLSEAQIADVAAWYESQVLPVVKPELLVNLKVPMVVNRGDQARGLPPCDLCHGADGRSVAGIFPVLAGQQAGYLETTMLYYKDGSRSNDPQGAIAGFIKKLTDDEIADIAVYYSKLGGRPLEEN